MCKHKSGGMSKPSGATSQGGLSERTTASISSHNCPPDSSGATSSQVPSQTNTTSNTDTQYTSQMRNFTTVHPHLNSESQSSDVSCDIHTTFLSKAESSRRQKYENISIIPNVPETCEHEYFESTESDEDDDTEQSPMLLNQACGIYCPPPEPWNPNMLSDAEFKDIHKPKHFGSCDPYSCSNLDRRGEAPNCDNYPMYHKLELQNALQKPVSYIPLPYHSAGAMTCSNYFENCMSNISEPQFSELNGYNYASKLKKKWFLNQKCKSADSEPDPHSSCITSITNRGMSSVSYSYVPEQSTKVPDMLITECHNYLKPTYSRNADPVAGPSGLQRPSSINWEMGFSSHDSEFRSRSYSLTPTVNFAVFESESSSEAEEVPEPVVSEPDDVPVSNELSTKTIDDPFEMSLMSLGKAIPISPSAAQLSIASSYGENGSPICKICHMTARENDPLISPCRCSGTMQYIHCGCLMRWLEVCHKRGRRPASCELCQYQYHWHKKFKIRHWQMPQCTRKDKILHLLFFLSVLLMITCASITVLCFKQDKGTKMDPDRTELTQSEIVTLICGVLFFFAFFVAMYVEVKSHDTLYQLLVKFIHINQQWYIDEYEKKETAPVAV